MKSLAVACLVSLALTTAAAAAVEDEEILVAMLHDFLANSATSAAHETFWADDLVYTSSSGQRFGKADILQGFESDDETTAVVYSGEDVDVRVYDDMAVVAFKLVGTPSDGSEVLHYYNTGTFVKRNGEWKAVAWQATKIPPPSD
ncbi:MAG: nuclear transport factor 2 family protein [Woeseiaceae bacterium]|nr:nuclear transport factor 2 family protein [Woeseiaceae bacterium]